MNTLLWIMQSALAFLYFSGGAFKIFRVQDVASQIPSVPHAVWRVAGTIEVVGAILLIVPLAFKWMPSLTPAAATVLALETLALAALYASHSLKIAVTNPLVWAATMGLLVAFVAYGRYAISPAV